MKIYYAKAIIDIRVQLNQSKKALVDMLGVLFSSVNGWENSKYEVCSD